MPRQQRREISAGVLLLAYQIFSMGYSTIPPVTLLTIAAQTAIFIGLIPALDYYKIGEICVSPNRIWNFNEWKRLILPTFVHGDDMHLYYNMISFLWKGRRLEKKFGSIYFAFMLVVFSILTNVVLVALSLGLDDVVTSGLSQQCAVGFSGVIFALKVLCNHYFPHEDSRIFGWLPVPSQFACWAELFLIQLLVPNASFVGHLAGILVGMAYVMGPLKKIMDFAYGMVSFASGSADNEEQGYTTGGYTQSPYGRGPLRGESYHHYTGGLTEEEQMRRAMDESLNGHPGRTYPSAPPPYPGYENGGTYNRIYPNVH